MVDSSGALPHTVVRGILAEGPRGFLGVLAQRKPALLFRFVGRFLLRFVTRRLLSVLFHAPPRKTLSLSPRERD